MAICKAESARAGERLNHPAPPTARTNRDCADITGILIDRLRRPEVMARLDQFVQSGRPHQVVTVNADFLNICNRDPSFIDLLNKAAISVPDGMPLVWLSRTFGTPLPERITGTDLLLDCAELAARKGYRMFLLGAAPGVADDLARQLTAQHPGLQIVGTYSPPYFQGRDPEAEAHMVEAVRAARPDMLFVAMGTPKQERWIAEHLDALGVPVCIGVGGVFNFLTGRIPRAPQAMQRLGLEWLFRLVLEPRRLWRRYLVEDTQALARALIRSRVWVPGARPRLAASRSEVTSSVAAEELVMPVSPVPAEPQVIRPAALPLGRWADDTDWTFPVVEGVATAPARTPTPVTTLD